MELVKNQANIQLKLPLKLPLKLFIILVLLFLQIVPNLQSKQYFVGQNKEFKTISSALKIANDYDSIIVENGVYREGNLIIKKSISLIGLNYPTLDGQKKYEILTIAAKNVTIKGFKINHSGRSNMDDLAAVRCFDANGVKIIDNILDDNFFGIHISNTDSALVMNNKLSVLPKKEYELGNGIHLWKCDAAKIYNNVIKGHRDGIYFEFATNCIIKNNFSLKNLRYGLHFMFSNNNQYIRNTFKNNGAGVAVMYTTNVLMLENHFEDNWGESSYGLLLKDIRDSKVIKNTFIKNTIGIYMEGTSRTEFSENLFKHNGWSVKLQASCDDNVFKINNFIANTFDISTNGKLVLNTINDNYWDKYEGYDLDKNGIGDIPYYPVNLFSVIVERIPTSIMLWRSFLVFLLDKSEKVIPAITPANLKDNKPRISAYDFNK